MTIDELEAENTAAALREGPVTYALLMNARRTRMYVGESDIAGLIEEAKELRPTRWSPEPPVEPVAVRPRTSRGTFARPLDPAGLDGDASAG